ncbi:MAG: enoyl-CoA hydratase/isomerase family protein [Candidatus Promineifilaceae bacterium]
MKKPIEYHVQENGTAVLQINRPEARNALNWAAQEAFAAAVDQAAHNARLRVLIVTGSGEQAFAAGADLKELSRHPEAAAGERLNRIMSGALAQLAELPLPVIAAINGDAFGGGCEIITACDLRIAAAHVRFSFAQVKNALTSGWGGTGRLVQLIGQSRAIELMLTARLFDVEEARQIGLVHRITPPGADVLAAALAWADDLMQFSRGALAANKALAHTAVHQSLAETNRLESELFVSLWPQPDHLEALQAFVEKRKPEFNGDR